MDHVHPSHDHDHSHGHGHHDHAHDHGHAHGDEYLEQLFTIGICGLFGMVAVFLGWRTVIDGQKGMLSYALAPQFHLWVLVGGFALLFLTLVRAAAIWRAAGAHAHHDHDHGPDHVHGPECDHGHDHADHDHSHGGIYWRAVVLLFPIVMFSLGLPNQGYSDQRITSLIGEQKEMNPDSLAAVEAKGGATVTDFAEMARAAYDPELRESLKGRRVTVTGRLSKISDRQFTLVVLKMTCCAADQIPLKARILSDAAVTDIPNLAFVEASGVLQFAPEPGKDEYLPVIRAARRDIKQIKGE